MTVQLRLAEAAFRAFLAEAGDNPPALRSFSCGPLARFDLVRFSAEFRDGQRYSWDVPGHELRQARERDLPPGVVEGVYDHLRREHIRQRRDAVEVRLDRLEPGWTVIEPGPAHLLTPEEHDRLQRELLASMEREWRQIESECFTVTVGGGGGAAGNHSWAFGTVTIDARAPGGGGVVHVPMAGALEADTRGVTLLREWLSPAQREQYDQHRHFDVVGCHTGKRYRIYNHVNMNIDELDKRGRVVRGLCFVPEGGLVAGDVMLAQKIALETNEKGALRVANSYRVGVSAAGRRVTMPPVEPASLQRRLVDALPF